MTDLKKGAAHAQLIAAVVSRDLTEKYMKGQVEHGGYLPEVPGLLQHAWEEAIDLPVYLYTLRQQLQRLHHSMLEVMISSPSQAVRDMLGTFADELEEILK